MISCVAQLSINLYCFLLTLFLSLHRQFTYNPEWFADEDDDVGEELDIEKYRRQAEAEHEAEEAARLAQLSIEDDGYRDAAATAASDS